MLIREYKSKLTVKQIKAVDLSLWQMRSVYNTALTKCFQSLQQNSRLISLFDLISQFNGHGKKADLNQDAIAECCKQVHRAFERWLYSDENGKKGGKPRRKSARRPIKSLTFGMASRIQAPKEGGKKIGVPGLGQIRVCGQKNDLPVGKIKGGRLVKKASGYYFQYVIDASHQQEINSASTLEVGLDPGFTHLLTLSTGEKIENPREMRKAEKRLGQAQRGKNKRKTARAHEKIKRQRMDRNHKISHRIVKDHCHIIFSEDSFSGMATKFGKSVQDSGLGNLLQMITYKSQTCGRRVTAVKSHYTTQTCSACGRRTGPSGLAGLGVRTWECVCGVIHDRDINAACVILGLGRGTASVEKR